VERKTGQSSLEFLYSVGAVLLVFSIASLLFFQSQQDVTAIEGYTQAKLACQEVSGRISAVASAGDGTASALSLPLVAGSRNYAVFVSGQNRTVSVNYHAGGVGCRFATSNVSNGSSQSFYVANDTILRNVKGGVLFG